MLVFFLLLVDSSIVPETAAERKMDVKRSKEIWSSLLVEKLRLSRSSAISRRHRQLTTTKNKLQGRA